MESSEDPSKTDNNSEEQQSLLRNENSIDSLQAKRDQFAMNAVSGLYQIIVVVAFAIIIAIILLFTSEFVPGVIPTWSIFLVVWLGHLSIFFVVASSIRLLLLSMLSKNDRERQSQRWHQANERRIPLLQFAIYHFMWILGLSTVLIVFEVLIYLSIIGTVSVASVFVIPYIIIGIAISNALICRFGSINFFNNVEIFFFLLFNFIHHCQVYIVPYHHLMDSDIGVLLPL
jgi:hypothetical protein